MCGERAGASVCGHDHEGSMPERTTAHQMFESVREVAYRELQRSSLGLAFSGLSAGLNISFSFVAIAALLGAVGEPDSAILWSAVAYPVGFILVILARAQLFTENTLTPVLLVLGSPTRRHLFDTLRLWGVVLLANLAGAFIFAFALAHTNTVPQLDQEWLLWAAEHAYQGSWGNLLLRAVFGGWLIALMVWMLHAGAGVVGQMLLVWLTAFLIQAAGFSHSVAGAVEVLYLAHLGLISYLDWAWHFQLPVTLGNIIGGVVFVALVNYAQVVGAGRDVEVARRMQRTGEAREATTRRAEENGGASTPGPEREPRRGDR